VLFSLVKENIKKSMCSPQFWGKENGESSKSLMHDINIEW